MGKEWPEQPSKTEGGPRSPEDISEEFLAKEESGIWDKMKTVLDVARPHKLSESLGKLVGPLCMWSGVKLAEIPLLRPEQMLVQTPDVIQAAELLGACFVVMGGIVLYCSVDEAYKIVKWEREFKKKCNK